ncbi:virulence factor [Meridianimarinicoccus sp. RP-17]|uniref:virulence factor n=1 Tax=Meridianimarinicoccus zhengii TaxID=2056810 RepID=UPI000DAEE0A0|nr:virulence factor [Phycocomes zhengii]
MPDITVVFWRDIPAQVLVGRGRAAVKRQLPERFEQAIDRAAMKAGLAGTEDYLAHWRRASGGTAPGSDAEAAAAAADRIDADYDSDRLRRLIDTGGVA